MFGRAFHFLAMAALVLCIAFSARADFKHGIAMYGDPSYPAGFDSFDYVTPDAPKGGVLRLASFGSYDSFNPYIINGIAPAGIQLTADTLMKQSDDEPSSIYGLVADGMFIDTENNRVLFHIHPDATFSDNSKITADDVLFSFNILKEKGLPSYRYYYSDVLSAGKQDDETVVFHLDPDEYNHELPFILGELPVLSQKYWAGKDFTKQTMDIPVTSGPYAIASFEPGRWIVYKRRADYWARDLNVNKGMYNFDEIRYDYYRDTAVALEAFKAGLIDLRQETEAKKWTEFKKSKDVQNGKIIMRQFEHHFPSGMQGFVYNLRRPIFADPRVREALAYAFDFEWANENLFFGMYKRTESYFDNSELKAPPLPGEEELVLLMPHKSDLPPRVFTDEYHAPRTNGNLRDNLQKALVLLKQAGWTVHRGVLRDKNFDPFEFEILLDSVSSSAWERITLPFIARLKKLGINAKVRVVDLIQYKNRVDSFDYDMIVSVWGQSLSPGNEQRYFWGSAAADSNASFNFSGIKSPVVDDLIEDVIQAKSRAELKTAVHALDRVLLWSFLVIPHWHTPYQSFVFWDKFGMPATDDKPIKGTNIYYWWSKPSRKK